MHLLYLGLNTHKHQDWFGDNDEEIHKLLEEKCKSTESFRKIANLPPTSRRLRKEFRKGWHLVYDKTENLQGCCTTFSVVCL